MLLKNYATYIIGVATISLVILLSLLGLVCLVRSLCFHVWVRFRRQGVLHLYSYFTGPSLFRVTLVLLSVYWSLGEISRLTFLNHKLNFLGDDSAWKERICKGYIVSNLGFAEPSMFLMLTFLLHAALQQGEHGTLNPKWSRKTIGCVILFCLPSLLWDLVLVVTGDRFEKFAEFFTRSSYVNNGEVVCTYPLLSTIFLGGFYGILMVYVTYVGTSILSLAINKSVRKRIYILMFSVITCLPLRAALLGISVVARPVAGVVYEVIVFLGFISILCCIGVGLVILVYFPVADMSDLRDPEQIELVRRNSDAISVLST